MYTPTVWNNGDVVSSERLNKLEEGVKDAFEVMIINDTDNTLDKTWQEIYDAMAANTFCVIKEVTQEIGSSGINYYHVIQASNDEMGDTEYRVKALYDHNSDRLFLTTSATGYPKYHNIN